MAVLIQSTLTTSVEMKSSVLPQDIPSGTLYGQYQLRGSILVIKDNLNTASGYLAFGTSMTAIPTSPTTGTGIYIDYRGIYGNASGTSQFYLQSSDGKAYAGGGAVVLDTNGIVMDADGGTYITWNIPSTNNVATYLSAQDNGVDRVTTSIRSNVNAGAVSRPESVTTIITGSVGYARLLMYTDEDTNSGYASIHGTSGFTGLFISASTPSVTGTGPDALLHLKSTAPTFLMQDTTSSAKSLLVTVDGNTATFEEAAGTDIMLLDLANARVGVGSAATSKLHVTTATASDGIRIDYTGASGSGNSPQLSMHTNDGAAMASSDRIGQLAFGGHNGTSVVDSAFIIAQATETWSGTARGSKITFFTTPNTTTTLTAALVIEEDSSITVTGEAEIDGALNHDGTTVGFYGVAPTTRQVLATGTGKTVDNVITALQNLGLVSQT